MRVADLRDQLEQRGVRVVVRRHLPLADATRYRSGVTQLDEVAEQRMLDTGTGGIVVRRSGWVWVLGSGGSVMRGHASKAADRKRIDASLDVLLDLIGLTANEVPDTAEAPEVSALVGAIGPDDDPVFAVPDEQEQPDDPREVAD